MDFAYETLEEFDNHKMVVFLNDSKNNLKGFIAIHRIRNNMPSFGATRLWHYPREIDALEDALRLSRLMSYKAALAGLPYGGAKGVIFSAISTQEEKENLLRAYVQNLNYLGGHFITGSDVGISEDDVKLMAKGSPHIVGVSVDPVKYTVLGVLSAIKACLQSLYGTDDLHSRTFAIQGLGKTGGGLLRLIYHEAKRIYVADVDEEKLSKTKENFPDITIVMPEEIYKQKVDVLVPCALAHTISVKTIPVLQCKIVCGSANNQLKSPETGEKLYVKGILYAPDYVANAGGLIAVASEYENKQFDEEHIMKKVQAIGDTIAAIIEKSKTHNKPTNSIADGMARDIFNTIV